ncbi:hypothetical protein EXW96_15095 [Paenibacillus sp. JMULE4]|uniref:hypothetical protein n=1 Tax=Paenibacillus sp. JMULE4 TaxID=2518342 RepID=UPI0015765A44|nr:hypothetical protein [Paenibacillus sp. JMULE4]NTZ18850.1 hypothetical protein [Paenibacillus sp. JMULE4]
MFKRFDVKAITTALEANLRFKNILQRIKGNGSLQCPYDGITFGFDGSPSSYFLQIVMPAAYDDHNVVGRRVYRYLLKHPLFIVCWEPLSMFNQAPYTIIKINPDRNNITPSQLLDLIKFIMGNYFTAAVIMFDEKVDIENRTPKSVAERLYVAHKRKLVDYKQKKQTYYFGSRKGMQVKVYDKSKLLKLKNKKLTRIEKTVKYIRNKRPVVTEFLLKPRTDMFENVVFIDTDKLDGRTKIMRLIKQEGIFMAAYKKLLPADRKALRRHQAFTNPYIDLGKLASDDLEHWLRSSPNLPIKIFIDSYRPHFLQHFITNSQISFNNYYDDKPVVYTGTRQWGRQVVAGLMKKLITASNYQSLSMKLFGVDSDLVSTFEIKALTE